jgi:hypothetical protein
MTDLRAALEPLVADGCSPRRRSPKPCSSPWHTAGEHPRPDTPPHDPMVLHRGAFPDGS